MIPTAPLVSAPNVVALLGLATALSMVVGMLAGLVDSRRTRRAEVRTPRAVTESPERDLRPAA